jgi:predicted Rossmann-fold nucleotide-binding protein
LFEVLTWRQLGLHAKPVLLLDSGGYWAPLVALIEHTVAQGFAPAEFLDFFEATDSVPALMSRLRHYLG